MFRLCAVRGCRWCSEIFCVNFKEEKENRDLRLQPSLSFLSEAWADPRGNKLEVSWSPRSCQVWFRCSCARSLEVPAVAESARLLVFWFWWKCPHMIFYLANVSKLRYVFDVCACTRRRADTSFSFFKKQVCFKGFSLWMFLFFCSMPLLCSRLVKITSRVFDM